MRYQTLVLSDFEAWWKQYIVSSHGQLNTSGADEYVPSKVNKAELTQRLAAACNGRPVVIDGADHACSGAATADAVERMVGFLVDALER